MLTLLLLRVGAYMYLEHRFGFARRSRVVGCFPFWLLLELKLRLAGGDLVTRASLSSLHAP